MMKRSWRLISFGIVGFVFHLGTAEAGLILRSFIDQTRRLELNLGWDPETADTITPNFLNWNVTVRMEPTAVEWIAVATVQHRVSPHAGESLPPFITLTAAVDRIITPREGGDVDSVLHPGIGHMDSYRLFFRHAVLPRNNLILLSGTHPPSAGEVPEPSPILLFISGLAALSLVKRMKPTERR